MRHNESTLWNAYALNPSKKGTLQTLCARMGKNISGEGEIPPCETFGFNPNV